MKIISVSNHKGGVGKTNTSINLAASLAHFSRSVLLVDLDPQGNASRGYGIDPTVVQCSIMDVLYDKYDINKAIQPSCVSNLDIIPAKLKLNSFDDITDKQYLLLKRQLARLKRNYDYVILDCPPSLGFLTMNAYCASNSVIIPVQCHYFALNAITPILASISNIQSTLNSDLNIEGVLLTMFDPMSELDKEIAEEIRKIFKEKTFLTRIPRTNSIPESNIKGIPVLMWRPTGKASSSYLSLAKEVIDNEGK